MRLPRILLSFCTAILATTAMLPRGVADEQEDRVAIESATKSYQEALAKGDAAALAGFWTEDGDIIDADGNVFNGRDAVSASLPPDEGELRPTLNIQETSLRFLTAAVALEDGTVEVLFPGAAAPMTGRFSAVWVKQDGTWLLAALREDSLGEPSGPEQLADLDWMTGVWAVTNNMAAGVGEGDAQPEITVTGRWNSSKTFLIRDMRVRSEGRVVLHVTQRVGWDSLHKQIRGWVFSSDGTHGEAVWGRDGQTWLAKSTITSPDGTQQSSLNIFTYDGKDTCHWKAYPTHLDGHGIPPLDMTLTRVSTDVPDEPEDD
jgi:uncharacterized protein (TIGR02246 family)